MSLFPTIWGGNSPAPSEQNPLVTLHQEMNRLFDSVGGRINGPGAPHAGWLAPRIDVSETDDAVQITAELPGVAEDQIDVTLVEDVLTIKGEKKSESTRDENGKTYRLVERSYGAFQRQLTLPFRADPATVSAQFDNGVLSVTVPKPPDEEAKSHRIAIGRK